jgi:hypothetical protein
MPQRAVRHAGGGAGIVVVVVVVVVVAAATVVGGGGLAACSLGPQAQSAPAMASRMARRASRRV